MKKRVSGFIIGLFLIAGLTQSGYAASWAFDVDGSGTSNAISVSEFFDVSSPNLVVTSLPDDAGVGDGFTFSNYGLFSVTKADSYVTDPAFSLITGEYEFSGTGTLGGAISFDLGVLKIFVGSIPVMTLSVESGEGNINREGYPNGTLSITYTVEDIIDGYFYWYDGTTYTPVKVGSLAMTTTNASVIENPVQDLLNDLLDLTKEDDGEGGLTEDDLSDYDLVLSSNGQFRLTAVPVPSAFFLLGCGIIGLVGFRRKIG
ncbi:hypothetical protein [uncultured Desulfobacter sp.]|uniref:hypothetical protein n=1 Tax=uncultured Desulfobacter sp. TaxID=240139 RepID=UPI0029F49839|nr:hypothetical protein [uncultured Desulfobacter sp.]